MSKFSICNIKVPVAKANFDHEGFSSPLSELCTSGARCGRLDIGSVVIAGLLVLRG